MSRPVFRFAPSPNGLLHLGHAYSALLNARMAEESGGRLLLRIEDTDETRARPEFVQAIFEDLAWLGLGWEEPVRIQSEHFADYEANLAKAVGDGCRSTPASARASRRRRTPCHRAIRMGSRITAAPAGRLPRDEAERRIARGDVHGWRLDTSGGRPRPPPGATP